MTETVAIDSSAVIAILNDEADAAEIGTALNAATRIIGWPTIFEIRLWVLRRKQRDLDLWLADFLASSRTRTVAFDEALETAAANAFDRFGKGRHPATLNFGDCMAYAVARHNDVPLLFKGADFGKTDIAVHHASVVIA